MHAVRRRQSQAAARQHGAAAASGALASVRPRSKGLHIGFLEAFVLLALARLLSAAYNIIHDCDEVYNYWEPLHYLLYGSGMQTWEYSSQFALRPYLYLLLHTIVAAPASWLFGSGLGKVQVFYVTKAALSLVSAATEAALFSAVREYVGSSTANLLLALLTTSAGMFFSASALLPSSFTMYALIAAAAAVLAGRPLLAEGAAILGVLWGWAVAAIAFVPYALWVLAAAGVAQAVAVGLLGSAAALGPLVLLDRHYYGRWTVSLWNFVKYNVAGGGDSALYGVEGPAFYLRNGALNLNLALALALALPAVALLSRLTRAGNEPIKPRLAVAVAPVYVWLAAISALPHKEERFLYVVYPLVCLAAAATLASLSGMAAAAAEKLRPASAQQGAAASARRALQQTLKWGSRWAGPLVVVACALLSLMRAAALVSNYGAPLDIYRQLPKVEASRSAHQQDVNVCVGAEWYRFPSSFFLPGSPYRLRFTESGFGGLLPRAFDTSAGGTAALDPPGFNDRNRAEPGNVWPADDPRCQYRVELQEHGAPFPADVEHWAVLAEGPFLDAARSPALTRALYIPWLSAARNRFGRYLLLQRRKADGEATLERLKSMFGGGS